MSQIWLPRTLTEQPDFAAQVDWRNPITRGLKFLNFPLSGGIVSAVNPALLQYQTTYGKTIANKAGLAIQQSSPLYPAFQTGQTGITGTNYSLFAVATAPGLSSTVPQNAIDDDAGGGTGHRYFQFRVYNGVAQMIVFDTSGAPYSASSANLGASQASGFSFGATVSGNSFAIWANGAKTIGAASNTQATPSGNFWIASNKAASTTYPGDWAVGGMNIAAGWNRTIADREMFALSANPWQLFKAPPRRIWAVSGTPANNLAGVSNEQQSATASAIVEVPVAAASIQVQIGAGVANLGVVAAGSATATQSASGTIQLSIPLNGASIQEQLASASAGLSTSANGASTSVQELFGVISVGVTLSGAAIQQAFASGALSVSAAGAVNLSGITTQTDAAAGTATMATSASGASSQQQISQSSATVVVDAQASSISVQLAEGTVTQVLRLFGLSAQAQHATGGLTVAAGVIGLSGLLAQNQSATASLTLRVSISAESLQQALNVGYLSGTGIISPDPRYTVQALGRNFTVQALGRNFTVR